MADSSLSAQADRLSPANLAEAARYALLRRLAPSMRHHLVVNLQPIGMIYEVMERRLQAPEPDLGHVQDSAVKINGFARAALESCLDVVTWLAPEPDAVMTVTDGVQECVGLLRTSLSFRGYALRNEVGELSGEVKRTAIRNVFTAMLIATTDEAAAPAELVLTAQGGVGGAVLVLEVRPSDGEQGFVPETGYRDLDWGDVQALAQAEGVQLSRGAARAELHLPYASRVPS